MVTPLNQNPGVIPQGSVPGGESATALADQEINPNLGKQEPVNVLPKTEPPKTEKPKAAAPKTEKPKVQEKKPKEKTQPANPVERQVHKIAKDGKIEVYLRSSRDGFKKYRDYYKKPFDSSKEEDAMAYATEMAKKYTDGKLQTN